MARGTGVGGVGVVKDGRGEERCEEDGQPEAAEQKKGAAARDGAARRVRGGAVTRDSLRGCHSISIEDIRGVGMLMRDECVSPWRSAMLRCKLGW